MEDLLLPLALILLGAEVGGYVSDRLGLTRVVGQIVVGLILGPSLLGLVVDSATIQLLASLGAIGILALAGLETDLGQLRRVSGPALLAAAGGVLLPLVAATALMRALDFDVRTALFVGAVLTATSVGVTTAALRELGLLSSAVGSTVMAAAVLDDVLGLVVLGLVVADTAVGPGGSQTPFLGIVAAMAMVTTCALLAAYLVRHRLARLLDHLDERGGGLAALVGLLILAAWVFHAWAGLAGITGAYVAGAALAETEAGRRSRERLDHLGQALCAPVFFVGVGLSVDLHALPPVLSLAVALTGIAVAGKLVGSGLGARLGGLDGHAATGVGLGMIARGEVALIAAGVGLTAGAIDQPLYAALIVMALATTILTPVGLAIWARGPRLVAVPRTTRALAPVRAGEGE